MNSRTLLESRGLAESQHGLEDMNLHTHTQSILLRISDLGLNVGQRVRCICLPPFSGASATPPGPSDQGRGTQLISAHKKGESRMSLLLLLEEERGRQ